MSHENMISHISQLTKLHSISLITDEDCLASEGNEFKVIKLCPEVVGRVRSKTLAI